MIRSSFNRQHNKILHSFFIFWAGKPRLESGITIVLLRPRGFCVLETSNKCPSHRHIECPRKRRLKRVAVGQLIFFLISSFLYDDFSLEKMQMILW